MVCFDGCCAHWLQIDLFLLVLTLVCWLSYIFATLNVLISTTGFSWVLSFLDPNVWSKGNTGLATRLHFTWPVKIFCSLTSPKFKVKTTLNYLLLYNRKLKLKTVSLLRGVSRKHLDHNPTEYFISYIHIFSYECNFPEMTVSWMTVTDVTVSCSLGKTASDALTDTTSAALAGDDSAAASLGSYRALV